MKYQIYVINLDRNTERLRRIKAQFVRQGLEFHRYPAFDGKSLEKSMELEKVHPNALLAARRGYRISHEEHNFGSIGCYISHIEVWKKIVESGSKFGIVMEDDIVIPSNFLDHLDSMFSSAPLEWELIVFGQYNLLEDPKRKKKKNNHTFIKARWILFNSYALTAQAAKSMLERVYPIKIQIDWWVSSQIKYYNMWIHETPITNLGDIGNRSDINHTPVVPDWLVAAELEKYIEDDGKPAIIKKTNSSYTNSVIIISIVVVAGLIICTVTTASIIVYYKKK